MNQRVIGGKYRILEPLSSGGMSVVYKAEHAYLKRVVAVKVLPPQLAEDPNFVKLFMREAEMSAQLDHPNIVKVFDFGSEGKTLYLVMQYIPGRTLDELLEEKGRLNLQEALLVMYQVLAALSYAHSKGVVHRDVKPSNILVTPDLKAYLFDFGIAAITEAALAGDKNYTVGTPEYMPPEQLRGVADARSDIYSAGVTLFELLTGTVPFKAERITDLTLKILKDKPPKPSELAPEVPEALDRVVLKAMAKLPSERYQSAAEFFEALKELKIVGPPGDVKLERGGEKLELKRLEEPEQPPSVEEGEELDLSITQFIPVAEEVGPEEEWDVEEEARKPWAGIVLFSVLVLLVLGGLGALLWLLLR